MVSYRITAACDTWARSSVFCYRTVAPVAMATSDNKDVVWKYSAKTRAPTPLAKVAAPRTGDAGRRVSRTLDDWYRCVPSALSDMLGQRDVIAGVVTSPALADDAPYVDALYYPETRTIGVAPRAAEVLERFLVGEWSTGMIAREQAEVWPLTMVVSVTECVLHAALHALDDIAPTAVQWWGLPAGHAWNEGVAELGAQYLIGPFLEATGLAGQDDRLLRLLSIRRRFAFDVEVVRALVDQISGASGRTKEEVVRDLLFQGGGRAGIWKAAAEIATGTAASVARTAGVELHPLVALHPTVAVLNETLASSVGMWSDGAGDTSFAHDVDLGVAQGASLLGRVQYALERLAARSKGVPDLSVLGRGLADAASASMTSVATQLGDVWDALDQMSAMGEG